jgi:hypothetical protein
MKVRNLNKVAQVNCSSGSWLAHWEKLSGLKAFMCFSKGCFGRPAVGGHVQKESRTDKRWYVVPLCNDCNQKRGQDLDVWDAATLVSIKGTAESDMGDYYLREPSAALPRPSRGSPGGSLMPGALPHGKVSSS